MTGGEDPHGEPVGTVKVQVASPEPSVDPGAPYKGVPPLPAVTQSVPFDQWTKIVIGLFGLLM